MLMAVKSHLRAASCAQGIWGHVRSLQRGDEIYLPSTFSHFGALPSARHFAELLVEALEGS